MPLPPATPTDTNTAVDLEPPSSPIIRKKKTPTQLRRERKKRQKERERRQNELERKLREDSSKSGSSSSLDYKAPDIADRNNGSGVDEEVSLKDNWSHLSAGPLTTEDRDASGESSENEMISTPTLLEPTAKESAFIESTTISEVVVANSEQFDSTSKELNESSSHDLGSENMITSQVPSIATQQPTSPISSSLVAQTVAESNCDSLVTIATKTLHENTDTRVATLPTDKQTQEVDSDSPPAPASSTPCEVQPGSPSEEQTTPLQTVPTLKQLATLAATDSPNVTSMEVTSSERAQEEQELREQELIDEESLEQRFTEQCRLEDKDTLEENREVTESPARSFEEVDGSSEVIDKNATDSPSHTQDSSVLVREE